MDPTLLPVLGIKALLGMHPKRNSWSVPPRPIWRLRRLRLPHANNDLRNPTIATLTRPRYATHAHERQLLERSKGGNAEAFQQWVVLGG